MDSDLYVAQHEKCIPARQVHYDKQVCNIEFELFNSCFMRYCALFYFWGYVAVEGYSFAIFSLSVRLGVLFPKSGID